MIFVDSSVWIDFFRGRDAVLVADLQRVMDEEEIALAAPVRVEILSGTSREDLPRLKRLLGAFAVFGPTQATWDRIDGWLEIAVRAGQRFGVVDLLVAALAAEQNVALWSLDRDFRRMEQLGFVQLYRRISQK